ncbi:MAG TPA: DUF1801 domain-containing protein [Candidatus Kapabacteria bacterium]|nr:DUF1801 domain-containing protein [Candidatus Kapabacteria bacterium]
MQIKANTPEEYIEQVPEDKKEAIIKLRQTILANLPKGFEETISYDMLAYAVPHSIYPNGYRAKPSEPLPFIYIAAQKNHISLSHMGVYASPELLEWFQTEYPKHSKTKLDMGRGCIRFKKPDQIPYDLIAELTRKMSSEEWIKLYEEKLL